MQSKHLAATFILIFCPTPTRNWSLHRNIFTFIIHVFYQHSNPTSHPNKGWQLQRFFISRRRASSERFSHTRKDSWNIHYNNCNGSIHTHRSLCFVNSCMHSSCFCNYWLIRLHELMLGSITASIRFWWTSHPRWLNRGCIHLHHRCSS